MANANIGIINVTNTFDDWRIATNDTANDRNQLRNSYYVKDEGNFRVANGILYLGNNSFLNALVVEGNSNISVGNTTTTGNLIVLSNATVGNLTILGNQIISGSTLLDTDLLLLRANSSTDGPATLRSRRTGTGNAELRFNNTSNVWQATSNAAVGYSTILTMANVENSTFSSSLYNVATASAVATAYSLGLSAFSESQFGANTVRVSQNSGSVFARANGVNFVNSANILITVTSGIAGNANVAFELAGGAGTQGATGPQGTIGAQGVLGAPGVGSPGPQGPSGTGSQGPTGPQGIAGSSAGQGAIGPQGPVGAQGPSGPQGTSGSAGTISDETSSSSTHYPVLTTSTSGTLSGVQVSSTKLYFQPSTGTLSATDFAVVSDLRLKDIHGDINDATDKVVNLSTVEYTWNDLAKNLGFSEDARIQVGLIAQEVGEVYSTLIHQGEDGYLRVNYDKLVPILVQAIKELNERVKKLEGK